jgi:septal ring factor EnvC (AmiA/AmiB activator)
MARCRSTSRWYVIFAEDGTKRRCIEYILLTCWISRTNFPLRCLFLYYLLALSMDVQSSTAPLLRQLESMERQNRARTANWAELENRLRSELEETVIQNETLSKERSEFKTKYTRLERSMIEQEQELKQSKRIIEDQTAKVTKLEAQLEVMEAQAEKREGEYTKVERLANEGVMRVRSEMTQTVVESEDRYRGQIEKLESELRVEHEKKSQLEQQVEQLLESSGMIVVPQAQESVRRETKPKKLRQAQGQAEILAGALGVDSDTDDDDDDDESLGHSMDRGENGGNRGGLGMNSFAALEQLTSRLRAAKIELEALRRNLRESEHVRESLVEELGESRTAKEKLPLFEVKVKELTQDNREMELEIQGLREDIADVRDMYRTQLNVLLEEKASHIARTANGGSPPKPSETEPEAAPPVENS